MKLWSERIMTPQDVEAAFGVALAPCPFCGNPHVGLWVGPTPHITCPKCEADGPAFEPQRNVSLEERQYRAALSWNARINGEPT
jgi:hypothetical protein